MDHGNHLPFLMLAVLLIPPGWGGEVETGISIDGLGEWGIVRPGEHLIEVEVRNAGDSVAGSSSIQVTVSRLHSGQVHQTLAPVPSLAPGESWDFGFTVDLFPGLYFLESNHSFGPGTPELEIRVSETISPRQEWRTPLQLPNKTHRLMAFYYPWYGTPDGPAGGWVHWVPERGYDSTHVPIIGFYDSRSGEVLRYHVRTAQSAGIDTFISSWWGPDNYIDEALSVLLDISAEFGFNVTAYVEIASNSEDLYQQLRYLLTEHGTHEAFLRIDGLPVVFIYSRVIGALELGDMRSVLGRLDAEGLGGFYVADKLDVGYLEVFDGIHSYSPLLGFDRYPELVSQAQDAGGLFAATIAPGYDDTIIRVPGMVVERDGGSFYEDSWEKVMLSAPEWVLITSWNEWHEGSELEASLEFGDLYLNLTAYFYGLFEEGRLTPRWEDRIEEIESMFANMTSLIELAEADGHDSRLMRRDLGVAEHVWVNYDYETAKMYLLRIKAAWEGIPEFSGVSIFLISLLIQLSRHHGGHYRDEGGLPGTVGAHERVELPLLDPEV